MAKVIPHNADNDDSYEAEPNMTDSDGDDFYERIVPASPVVINRGKVTYKRPDSTTANEGTSAA
jgi:hypothetical protein